MLQLELCLLLFWTRRQHSNRTGWDTLLILTTKWCSKEKQTGLMTGLGDYIQHHAPYASGMGCAEYDDYYKPPWATSPHMEQRHRQLSAQIGTAVKGDRYYIIRE